MPAMKNKEIIAIIEALERKRIFQKLQNSAEKDGHIPPMPNLILIKLGRPIQIVGGILIGLIVGIFTVIANYYILVTMLHLEW